MTALYDIQRQIETLAFTKAASLKQEQIDRNIDNGTEHNLPYAQQIINEILPIAVEFVEDMYTRRNMHFRPFYWDLVKRQHEQAIADKSNKVNPMFRAWEPSENLALIASVLLTSNLSRGSSVTSLASKMFRAAMAEFKIRPDEYALYSETGIGFFYEMIFEIAQRTDVFSVEQYENREYRLKLSAEWRDRVEEIQDNFALNVSRHQPMVVPPKRHKNLTDGDGGALESPTPLMKDAVKVNGKVHPAIAAFNDETQPEWFADINRAQETKYCVNHRLFEAISYLYDNEMTFKKFPVSVNRKKVAEAAQESIDARNAKRLSNAERFGGEYTPLLKSTEEKVFNIFDANADEEVRKTKALFKQVEMFGKFDNIYFNLFVDRRQRRYPYANTGLSFQGDEMGKALLQFSNKEVLTEAGVTATFQTLGNVINHIGDKIVLETKERMAKEWFYSNLNTFLAGDFSMFPLDSHLPEKDQVFDKPVEALAIVLELVEWVKDPTGFKSGMIHHRDARCSGASIIGTILRDKSVMEMTSVVEWDNEGKLGDAYMASALKAQQICQILADDGNDWCQALLEIENQLFTRKMFKNPVMVTSSYGGTEYGMREHTRDEFDWEAHELTKQHKKAFDTLMKKALDAALPSCSAYLDTIRKAAKEVVDRDGMFSFTNPITGFPVVCQEFKTEKKKISFMNNFKRIKFTLITPTNKLDKMGMCGAAAPAVIHSLDVALIHLVESQCDFDLACVHDSYGAGANNVHKVVEAYGNAMGVLANSNVFDQVFESMGVEHRVPMTNTFTGDFVAGKHCLV